MVIDEEQRFGVMHKEKFKQLRRLVDVLTLSATPIPRTLYLALTGARDMSTIETPPQDRLPVETIVAQYDERLIRDAIQRELNRGGQVFFLHNRVGTIETVAQKLRALLPTGANRRRPRPDARGRTGGGHDQLRQRAGRRAAFHDDHRERERPGRALPPRSGRARAGPRAGGVRFSRRTGWVSPGRQRSCRRRGRGAARPRARAWPAPAWRPGPPGR